MKENRRIILGDARYPLISSSVSKMGSKTIDSRIETAKGMNPGCTISTGTTRRYINAYNYVRFFKIVFTKAVDTMLASD